MLWVSTLTCKTCKMLPMAYLFLIGWFICIGVSDDEKVNSIDTLQEFR